MADVFTYREGTVLCYSHGTDEQPLQDCKDYIAKYNFTSDDVKIARTKQGTCIVAKREIKL